MKYDVLANRIKIGEIETDEIMDNEVLYRPGFGKTIEFRRNPQDELFRFFMACQDSSEIRATACLCIVVETMHAHKISAIKFVRSMTGLGLKDTKGLVDALIEYRKGSYL